MWGKDNLQFEMIKIAIISPGEQSKGTPKQLWEVTKQEEW